MNKDITDIKDKLSPETNKMLETMAREKNTSEYEVIKKAIDLLYQLQKSQSN